MNPFVSYPDVAREVARRLRENDARGDEPALRELGAKTIEHLVDRLREERSWTSCRR